MHACSCKHMLVPTLPPGKAKQNKEQATDKVHLEPLAHLKSCPFQQSSTGMPGCGCSCGVVSVTRPTGESSGTEHQEEGRAGVVDTASCPQESPLELCPGNLNPTNQHVRAAVRPGSCHQPQMSVQQVAWWALSYKGNLRTRIRHSLTSLLPSPWRSPSPEPASIPRARFSSYKTAFHPNRL